MVALALLSLRFSPSAIFCGIDAAGDLEKAAQGGSVNKWVCIPAGCVSVADAMGRTP